MTFRDRLSRLLIGRNGVDNLSKFFWGLSMFFLVITLFTNNGIVYLIAMGCLIYSYFRIMSRNISKRYYENQQYMSATAGIRSKIKIMIARFNQRKVYKYFTCPECKQKVRVPRGRGKIAITCPKCRTEFIKRS